MIDCLDIYLRENLPFFFADPILLVLFLVELCWLLALRARGMGTLAFYMWQYVSTSSALRNSLHSHNVDE